MREVHAMIRDQGRHLPEHADTRESFHKSDFVSVYDIPRDQEGTEALRRARAEGLSVLVALAG
eukprot:1377360-Ditylum_brightwellii.AAC.1